MRIFAAWWHQCDCRMDRKDFAEGGGLVCESVRITKIEYWVEELGQWVVKKDKHTFFPSRWDMNKVEQVIKEATQNIIEHDGRRFIGEAKNGTLIEFFIDSTTRELKTAYIVFRP